jgi:hypothetical protein
MALPSLLVFELVLLDFLRELDAGDHYRRIAESFEPEHRPNPLFHPPTAR